MKDKNTKISIRSLAQEVFSKAIYLTQTYPCDIFVDYRAHVEYFTVSVYHQGWHNNKRKYDKTVYLDYEKAEEKLHEILDWLNLIHRRNLK